MMNNIWHLFNAFIFHYTDIKVQSGNYYGV